MADEVIRHIVIRGRVQGVGFRHFVQQEGLKRPLRGWVRNRRDGGVEAVLAGPPEVVAEMLAACRRGPPVSTVDTIEEREGTAAEVKMCGGERFALLSTV